MLTETNVKFHKLYVYIYENIYITHTKNLLLDKFSKYIQIIIKLKSYLQLQHKYCKTDLGIYALINFVFFYQQKKVYNPQI